jgi:histidinol-phosphate aminotransferase
MDGDGLNRYPDIQPAKLQSRLANLYAVPRDKLLVTRGSTEAIDMLIRAFCRPYTDNVVITPPTFSKYRVYADVQGAQVIDAPLLAHRDFALDPVAVLARCTPDSKLIFVCSPNNPTGGIVSRRELIDLARARAGKSLLVVDEAYIEFSDQASLASEVSNHENLVVLRTLSKAYGLAGARCGAVIASAPVVRILSRIMPPYSFSTPVTECVLDALADDRVPGIQQLLQQTVEERNRIRARLSELACVRYVWPSSSNFLLVRFEDLAAVRRRLADASILVREFSADLMLNNCARITIGDGRQNDQLLAALNDIEHSG